MLQLQKLSKVSAHDHFRITRIILKIYRKTELCADDTILDLFETVVQM
jgi:hypothetical protein